MLDTWMNRCVGRWVSYRGSDEVRFEIDVEGDGWVIMWGECMEEVWLEGDWLHCGKVLRIEKVDLDTVVFWSEEGGVKFREEIRLIHSDRYRLRQIVCYNINGDLINCGQYFEERL